MALIVSLMENDRVVFNHRFSDVEHAMLRDSGACLLVEYPRQLGYKTGRLWLPAVRTALDKVEHAIPPDLTGPMRDLCYGLDLLAEACTNHPDAAPSVISRCPVGG